MSSSGAQLAFGDVDDGCGVHANFTSISAAMSHNENWSHSSLGVAMKMNRSPEA